MLIFRYLVKEVFVTLAALNTILLLIFMSNQLVHYLNNAAAGRMPAMIIMQLMMLELPNLLCLLLPLGFYIALLLSYGRLYAENEMTVLQSAGYGPTQLYKHSFIMAGIVAIAVTIIMIWGSPIIAMQRTKLLNTTGIKTMIQTIVPGNFQSWHKGQLVFYVEKMNPKHSKAQNVFIAKHNINNNKQSWDIVWAKQAFVTTAQENAEDYAILQQGKQYSGTPGTANYRITEFSQYKTHLPPTQTSLKHDLRTAKITDLLPFFNQDLAKAAELQWRISIPLMVLTLTLVGIPLSRVNPRAGKYAKLLPAITLYIIYANCMFISRDWLAEGKIPIWVGMWWLHLLVALIGLVFIWRNHRAVSGKKLL